MRVLMNERFYLLKIFLTKLKKLNSQIQIVTSDIANKKCLAKFRIIKANEEQNNPILFV